MEDMFNNYRMVEEVKERAVNRGSGVTEFESYDRVVKIERRSGETFKFNTNEVKTTSYQN